VARRIVDLCGGAGTRLWPVSREKMPKQFVPLIGTSSTFQQVVDRVTREGLFAPPMIITNSEFRFASPSRRAPAASRRPSSSSRSGGIPLRQ
jgi:mannose-1-phosphate guanylyltransferase